MADFTIVHRIDAPELTAAINSLADALRGRPVGTPAVPQEATRPAQEVPAQTVVAPAAPVSGSHPTVAPATNTVNGGASATTAVQSAAPAPATVPAPVTGATSDASSQKVYTFESITAAGSQLLEMGRMNQLMNLLRGYGVQAVTQLKPEQYADVALGLRKLGANI